VGPLAVVGATELFGTPQGYHDTVDAMNGTGTLLDEAWFYFDARLSRHYPTVELRVGDVCLRVNDAVLLASLAPALVETASREWRLGKPPPQVRLERCTWPSGEPAVPAWRRTSCTPLPAGPLPPGTSSAPCCGTSATPSRRQTPKRARRPEHRPDADSAARGNGAMLQRRVHESTGDMAAVVRNAVSHTLIVE